MFCQVPPRVAHFVVFGKTRFFTITFKLFRISRGNIDSIFSLESEPSFGSIYSVRILDTSEVIMKISFSKIAKS